MQNENTKTPPGQFSNCASKKSSKTMHPYFRACSTSPSISHLPVERQGYSFSFTQPIGSLLCSPLSQSNRLDQSLRSTPPFRFPLLVQSVSFFFPLPVGSDSPPRPPLTPSDLIRNFPRSDSPPCPPLTPSDLIRNFPCVAAF